MAAPECSRSRPSRIWLDGSAHVDAAEAANQSRHGGASHAWQDASELEPDVAANIWAEQRRRPT